MSIVTLVSGGVDSTILALFTKEQRLKQYPLFVDYGQRAAAKEWQACQRLFRLHKLPKPARMNIAGYGKLILSGITSPKLRVRKDAFLPGRNLMFLVAGAAYATLLRSNAVAIGLLNDSNHLFPDQSNTFVQAAELAIKEALGEKIAVLTPLMVFNKSDMLALSEARRVTGTYSCHTGKAKPCGRCVSCLEVKGLKAGGG